MPNWCNNALNICGPPKSIDKFMDDITTGPGESDGTNSGMGNDYEILNNLVPVPESLKEVTSRFGTIGDDDPEKEQKQENIEEHGAVDWYEWCCTNWGTKWGDNQTHLVHEDLCTPYSTADDTEVSLKKVMLRFDSAWSPPIEGMDVVASKYPDIMFDLRYWEPGMGFQGFKIWGSGESQHEATMDYMEDADMAYDNIDYSYDQYCPDADVLEFKAPEGDTTIVATIGEPEVSKEDK